MSSVGIPLASSPQNCLMETTRSAGSTSGKRAACLFSRSERSSTMQVIVLASGSQSSHRYVIQSFQGYTMILRTHCSIKKEETEKKVLVKAVGGPGILQRLSLFVIFQEYQQFIWKCWWNCLVQSLFLYFRNHLRFLSFVPIFFFTVVSRDWKLFVYLLLPV